MTRPVAVLDADVLVPVLSCDLLLSMFDAELFQPVVTSAILDEVERNLIADLPHLEASALRRRVAQMAAVLSLHMHAADELPPAAIAGINRKDRHVVSVAIAQRADLVVTNDRRLRREINALDGPLRAVTNDEFALQLLIADRGSVNQVIDTLVAKRHRHPVTRGELLDHLAQAFPRFVVALGDGV